MYVKLAGFNVDVKSMGDSKILTPEIICASYARISRSKKPIHKLREIAREDVEKARKSNQNIVFDMGHSSIAEHANFNFDIIGVSRRLVEDIEKQRLVSFTEKSQRYVELDNDFVVPQEIINTPLVSEYLEVVEIQNSFYHKNLDKLINYHSDLKENSNKSSKTIEGYGKEDARYAVSMATEAQLGMTINGRNLEKFIRYLRGVRFIEAQELASNLINETKGIAPSLLKYTDGTDYDIKTRDYLRSHVSKLIDEVPYIPKPKSNEKVNLFNPRKTCEVQGAGLIFSSSFLTYGNSLKLVRNLSNKELSYLINNVAHKFQESYDPKLREIELEAKVLFELILSSSAFAQLKRHRIATIIKQDYNINLEPTIPESITKTGLEKDLRNIVMVSSEVYKSFIENEIPVPVAEMILTNAHNRRVLFSANPREFHAFASLRCDEHAQWDIKNISFDIARLLIDYDPIAYATLSGKDNFYKNKVN